MKIQYCSDLHLEFPSNSLYLQRNIIKPIGDILILAGDTTYIGDQYFLHPIFDYLSSNFKMVYLIPGNHEYYKGYDLSSLPGPFIMEIRKNIHLVNNFSVVLENTNLIFSTLWSKISPQNQWLIEKGVSDFHLIRYNGKRFSAEPFNQLFEISFQFIKNAIENNSSDKIVVVTHHLPSDLCNAEEFKNSYLNQAFCVNLTDFIHGSHVDYWVYGHSHRNMPPFRINRTTMVTNQLGYVDHNEHLDFKADAVISL